MLNALRLLKTFLKLLKVVKEKEIYHLKLYKSFKNHVNSFKIAENLFKTLKGYKRKKL